jgi:tetratricopeptide (TPR) repeat protein
VLTGALLPHDSLTPETQQRWETHYAAARARGDQEQQLTALLGLWGTLIRGARYREAQAMIETADVLRNAAADPVLRMIDDWMRGLTAHHLGDQRAARTRLERLLRTYSEAAGRPMVRRFGYDIEAGALTVLESVLTLMGAFQEAEAVDHRALAKPRRPGHGVPPSTVTWRALVFLYFIEEDDREVDRLTLDTLEAGRGDPRSGTVGIAKVFRGLWLGRQGDLVGAVEMVDQGLAICDAGQHHITRALARAEFARLSVRQGGAEADVDPASALFEEPDPESWCTPEILRIRGEIAQRQGQTVLAGDYFRQGFEMSERQGATIWALRNAIGLAGLWLAQARASEAAEILTPILGRLCPDAQHPDVSRAQALIDASRRARARA